MRMKPYEKKKKKKKKKEKQLDENEVQLIIPINRRISFEGNIRSAFSRSSLVRRKNVASVKLSGQLTCD